MNNRAIWFGTILGKMFGVTAMKRIGPMSLFVGFMVVLAGAAGENIFQNNLYDRVMITNGVRQYDWNSVDRIAETTVDGWMKSPGHRKNILMPHWVSEGLGVSVSPDDKVYITQNFC